MRDKIFGQIICKRIAGLIKANNLTIERLAYQSGISKGGLSEIVRGKKEPSNYTIMKICVTLNITMAEFYDYEELNKFIKEQY